MRLVQLFAQASAFISGVVQDVSGATAIASVLNSGSIDVTALANANGGTAAFASAFVSEGISQSADATVGTATVSVDNSGNDHARRRRKCLSRNRGCYGQRHRVHGHLPICGRRGWIAGAD